MRSALALVFVLLLPISFVSAEPEISKEVLTAGQSATDALARLEPAATEPRAFYEPRKLEAEKALDSLRHKVKTPRDKDATQVLRNWYSDITAARTQYESGNLKLEMAARYAAAACHLEASVIFDPQAEMTAYGRAEAAKKSCTPKTKAVWDAMEANLKQPPTK